MFPIQPLSHLCMPLPTVLPVGSYKLLSSGSWISLFGCWIFSIEVAYLVVLGVGCYDRQADVRLEEWNYMDRVGMECCSGGCSRFLILFFLFLAQTVA